MVCKCSRTHGGFGGSADPKWIQLLDYDPPISKEKKIYAKGGHGSRKKWLDYLRILQWQKKLK